MAAGKNAASAILEKYGFAALDADELVHGAVQEIEADILSAFSADAAASGIRLVGADGRLDRRALGRLVFPRPELLARQEALVYPAVVRRAEAEIAARISAGCAGVILNAAVLYKTPALMERCGRIIFVDAPAVVRLARALRRDNLRFGQVVARFRAQSGLFSAYAATGIPMVRVWNCGGLAALERKLVAAFNRRI